MSKVKFYREEQIPLEMHKVRVVQKLTLLPVEERLKKIQEAGNNTFLLQNRDHALQGCLYGYAYRFGRKRNVRQSGGFNGYG